MATRTGDTKRWIDQARAAGWRVEKGGKHWRLYPLDRTKAPVTISHSPGHGRTLKNIRADLRRAGLEVDL